MLHQTKRTHTYSSAGTSGRRHQPQVIRPTAPEHSRRPGDVHMQIRRQRKRMMEARDESESTNFVNRIYGDNWQEQQLKQQANQLRQLPSPPIERKNPLTRSNIRSEKDNRRENRRSLTHARHGICTHIQNTGTEEKTEMELYHEDSQRSGVTRHVCVFACHPACIVMGGRIIFEDESRLGKK